MDIRAFQEHTQELKAAQGWEDLSAEQRLVFLMQEVGEVAREVLWLAWDPPDRLADRKDKLGMEIYDVVWNLCDLANIVGVDLQACFDKKIELNRQRRWTHERPAYPGPAR